MNERIYIKELKELLNSKDKRTNRMVKSWCENNNVALYSDIGSNKLYVFREEFERVYLGQKKQYNCPELINSTMKLFSQTANLKSEKSQKHVPQLEHEKRYLAMLQNVICTL